MDGNQKKSLGRRIVNALLVYKNPKMLLAFWMGIASGFPLLLTGGTLVARMSDAGVDVKSLGLLAMVGLPYTLKFLWAPLVDAIKFRNTHLGNRRAWLLISQICIAASLCALAFIDGESNFTELAFCALSVAFFSSVQDIVIDALRVEMFPTEDQGAAAAALVSGYRVGMLLAGAVALMLAEFIPWTIVYLCAAAVMVATTPLGLYIRIHPGVTNTAKDKANTEQKNHSFLKWLLGVLWLPLRDFFVKRGRKIAFSILAFIALYKLGDAMASNLTMKFYLDLGFSKLEIAGVTKIFGFSAVLAGTAIGGMIVKACRMSHALIFCGTLQLLSNLAFVWLSYTGPSVTALAITVAAENVTGGMGTAAFVAFMASLCNVEFTATQYALFSALSSVGRTTLSSVGGYVVDQLDWAGFFVFTSACAVPGMMLLFMLKPQLDIKNRVLDKETLKKEIIEGESENTTANA